MVYKEVLRAKAVAKDSEKVLESTELDLLDFEEAEYSCHPDILDLRALAVDEEKDTTLVYEFLDASQIVVWEDLHE